MSLPARIGELRVDALLGEGGMGCVYRCFDAGLARAVAVKVLRPELLTHPTMRERFVREARALAKVESPAIVDVYAIGDDPAVGPYVVMELLQGTDALALLERGPLAVDDVITIGATVARGLADAHDKGVLHRDIKPANLFLRGGVVTATSVVITDFGLAKDTDKDGVAQTGEAQLTSADIIVGTPTYLAPELARGAPASTATDLYALGATLFHLLCGRPPFPGSVPLDVLTRAVLEPAPRATSLRADVPAALDDLLDALLQKADRPKDAAQVAARLAAMTTTSTATSTATNAATATNATNATNATTATNATNAANAAQATQVLGSLSGAATPEPPVEATPTTPPTPLTSQETSGAGVRTATMTVMFTDIAGYTERTSRQSREEAARWLDVHDGLLQPVFRAFGGKVVKTIGDAFLVVFSSPTDAVHCGMAIQDRLSQHNAGASANDRIDVRVALSAGEVRLRGRVGAGGDIFGEPVNLAARLEGIAAAGEVLFTDAVFATMNHAEVAAVPRGTHNFKGIARPVGVYAVAAGSDALPFGGTTLPRVTQSERAPARALKSAARDARRGLSAALARVPRRAVIVVIVVVVVVVAALALAGFGGDDRRARARGPDAALVIAEIEAIRAADRDANDLLDYAVALRTTGKAKDALVMLRAARDKGADRNDVENVAYDFLDNKEADVAIDIVVSAGDDTRLRTLLASDAWWPRHHALSALEKRSVATDDDRQVVGLKDVGEKDCASRRVGVGLLKRAGRGEEAQRALAGLSPQANLCMLFEIGAAQDAVRKRSDDKPKR